MLRPAPRRASVHSDTGDGYCREVVTNAMPSLQTTDGAYRRVVLGTIVALVGLAALLFLMLPIRSHLTIAAPALVFVVPVILGVVVGGFVPGAVGAVAGFLLYDIFFLPPVGTLGIRAAQAR